MKRNKTLKNIRRRNKKFKQRRRKTHKGGMVPALGSAVAAGRLAAGRLAGAAGVALGQLGGPIGSIFGSRGKGSNSGPPGPPGPAGLGGPGGSAPAPAGFTPSVSAATNLRFSAGPAGSGAPFSSLRPRNASSTASRLTPALTSAPIQARLPPASPRPGRRYSLEEVESISTTKDIRELLEVLEPGSTREFPPGTRTKVMRVKLDRLIEIELTKPDSRIYNPTVEQSTTRRAALNQSIPRIYPELSTPGEATTRTPISDEVGRFASEGGIEAGESARLFEQATGDAQALVDEVVPLNGRNLLTPIAEQGGQTAAQAISLLPEIPVGEQPTAAEKEAILDSIFPARVLGRAFEIAKQNIKRQEGVQRGVMPERNVNEYNKQIRELISVALVHTPAAQVRQFTEVFTPPRLTRLKASLGAYFLRNPLDARLSLDELFSILPRAQYNGAILDNLITNLAAQPERALAELIRASAAIQTAALEAGQIQAMTFAKGMGWFAARAFYSLIAAGLGIVGLFAAAWANINSTEDLAREIRINREIFDVQFPVAAEFRDRAALFFQGAAAAIMDGIYDRTGIQRPAQRPSAAPAPPPVIQPSPEVWAWARYIGEYSRMLRDLVGVVTAQRRA
jgi:hypothetical protein